MINLTVRKTRALGIPACTIWFFIVACTAAVGAEPLLQDTDVLADVRELSSAFDKYPQHAEELAELRGLLSEVEQSSAEVAALDSGVQRRGLSAGAPEIKKKLVRQSSRARALQKRIRIKRRERQDAFFDENIDSSKSEYEKSREQYVLALRILRKHVERQQQTVQKITQ